MPIGINIKLKWLAYIIADIVTLFHGLGGMYQQERILNSVISNATATRTIHSP